MTILKIERLENNKILPEYKTEGAAGMDLCAAIDKPVVLKPLGIVLPCQKDSCLLVKLWKIPALKASVPSD